MSAAFTMTSPAAEMRRRGGAIFAARLSAMFEAAQGGQLLIDPHAFALSLATTVCELGGNEREGFLMAWSWWSAVCVEGVVLSASEFSTELQGATL